jgi:NDP-sugar pyrophosphorylase family protein
MKSAGIIAAGWGERLGQKVPKALTPVGGRALIDFTLDGLEAAGVTNVTCIVNEAARAVPDYVQKSGRKLKMDWIIQTTPSSMHSFLIVLERLANQPSPSPLPKGRGPSPAFSLQGEGGRRPDEGKPASFFITTVDSVCSPSVYASFDKTCGLFNEADVCLGLTKLIDDEKPLRVAMRGREGTGILPERVSEDPTAYEIVALTTNGFDSEFVTAGFYHVSPRILKEKASILEKNFTALRQCLGHLLKYGYRFYGAPLPPVVDVDRPQDVRSAEALFKK